MWYFIFVLPLALSLDTEILHLKQSGNIFVSFIMSRLKRQRLTSNGLDRVTSATHDATGRDEDKVRNMNEQQMKHQGRSLFVRSLAHTVTSESLTTFFSQSLPVKHATVVIDSESKQSKGYGFVTFADAGDAQSARDATDGSLFEGRKIKVELAEPRHRQANEGGPTSATKGKARPGLLKRELQQPPKLIVRNLPWTIKEPEHLAVLFRSYGKVKHATLPKEKPGLSAGFGFVVLRGRKNAERALEHVNGKEVDGRTLAVDWAVEKEIWEISQNRSKGTEIRDQNINALTVGEAHKSLDAELNAPQSDIENFLQSNAGQSASPDREDDLAAPNEDEEVDEGSVARATDNSDSTLFIRNLPFSSTDESLKGHFEIFGPVRYARIVLDHATERPKGTGFVCYYNQEDADSCLREAPRIQLTPSEANAMTKSAKKSSTRQSLLEDANSDRSGRYTIEGRVLQLARAVNRHDAARLTFASSGIRDARDKDRRRLYLLSEGTVPSKSPISEWLSPYEIKMREDSAKQRQSLIKSNPMLHLSLTRLSIRNLPRSTTTKDLKALAREAVVGFAKDVKSGLRKQLSREELSRGGEEMKRAEKARKAKGKGIVKQAKIMFEGREGSKVKEDSGAGRSRGYGFIEYSSHRWALMGLRWLNGHAVGPIRRTDDSGDSEKRKRLIAEFAIENAQVVSRRHERETKARERSRFISEKMERGDMPNPMSKPLTKDQLMAKMRKGVKRRRVSNSSPVPDSKVNEENDESEKLAKRQQIIGRKRMLRRSRNQPASLYEYRSHH